MLILFKICHWLQVQHIKSNVLFQMKLSLCAEAFYHSYHMLHIVHLMYINLCVLYTYALDLSYHQLLLYVPHYVSYYSCMDCVNRVICVKNESCDELYHLIIIYDFMQFDYLERQVHVKRILLLR